MVDNQVLENTEEIEKIFINESREKKKIGNGVMHRASRKKGYKGGVKFLSDMLTGKEKKEYMKAGEVKISNIYDKIMPLKEFKKLDTEKRTVALTNLLQRHTRKQLAEVWGSISLVNNYCVRLGLNKKNKDENQSEKIKDQKPKEVKKVIQEESKKENIEEQYNMTLSINDLLNGQELEDIIIKLSQFIIKEKDYQFNFKLEEMK